MQKQPCAHPGQSYPPQGPVILTWDAWPRAGLWWQSSSRRKAPCALLSRHPSEPPTALSSASACLQRSSPDPNVGPRQPPEEVERLGPRALSFWISSLFHDSQLRQQSLLEVRPSMELGHAWLCCHEGT